MKRLHSSIFNYNTNEEDESIQTIEKFFKGSQKQLPLKKTLIFLFLDFLRGIATAVFIRKHNK
jgi:hypothetical protein